MTQEEKDLLLKDLCARLPYGVRISHKRYDVDATAYYLSSMSRDPDRKVIIDFSNKVSCGVETGIEFMDLEKDRPYLRPISSMTEEEKLELLGILPWHETSDEDDFTRSGVHFIDTIDGKMYITYPEKIHLDAVDWLNAHHFDYRGLIEHGLALEAPEGMYK